MQIVVIGGGIAGMASAARLAKLGHQVTLIEVGSELGGALKTRGHDGRGWDAGTSLTLPGVLRDLFRKSGRPLERELDLTPVEVIRTHVFTRPGAPPLSVELRSGRAAQRAAWDQVEPGLGQRWIDWVDSFADEWELLRRHLFEAWDPVPASDALTQTRRSLARRASELKDPRLIAAATLPWLAAGHDPRRLPGWGGLIAYLEMTFGAWRIEGGSARLVETMTSRLSTRRVEVVTGTAALDLVVEDGSVTGVRTAEAVLPADRVVVACDPHRLPALDTRINPARGAIPGAAERIELLDSAPALGHEVVLHSSARGLLARVSLAPIVIRPQAATTPTWTVMVAGRLSEDVLAEIASRQPELDVRDHVVSRREWTEWTTEHGSPWGSAWGGRYRHRLAPITPIDGVYGAGAWSTGMPGLSFTALTGAAVAGLIGPG